MQWCDDNKSCINSKGKGFKTKTRDVKMRSSDRKVIITATQAIGWLFPISIGECEDDRIEGMTHTRQ